MGGCATTDTDDAASSSSAASAGCTTTSTSGRTGVEPLPIPPPQLTVDNPGAQPRAVAAAAPNRSTPQQVTLSVTSSAVSSGGAQGSAADNRSQSVELPLTGRFHCTDSTDVEFDLGRPTSPEQVLDEQLGAIDGSTGGIAMGPGLLPISLRLIPNEKADSEARHAVEQTLVQALQQSIGLPTEPIGVGAVWRSERTINAAVTVTQTITATLKSRQGNRLVVDVAVDETPVNSVFSIPGSAQTLTITRYSMEGTGTLTLDLDRGLPVEGTTELSGARELVGADAATPIIQQTGLSVTWRSR